MWSWSCDNGTDGRVPREALRQVAGGDKQTKTALAELVTRGVISEEGTDLVIRDFLQANISKEADEDRREAQNLRQKRHRADSDHASVTRDKTTESRVTNDAVTGLSLDHDHDHDHDHTNRSDHPSSTDLGRSAIVRGFERRWRAKGIGDIWPGVGKHRDRLDRWAEWAAADPARLDASLDGFFADKGFPTESRYAFAAWANDPQRWVPTKPAEPPRPLTPEEAVAAARARAEERNRALRIARGAA